MTTTTMRSSTPVRVNTPETQDNINRVLAMLQSGIGVEDEGTRYNDLKQLERKVLADVKSGKMSPENAFIIAQAVRKQLTTEALQRVDAYFNEKSARGNLETLIDSAVDGRTAAQTSARMSRQMQTTIVNLRHYDGPPQDLIDASNHITELEGKGQLDPIGAAAMRQAIDARLSEMVNEGKLTIAPPPAAWNAFVDSQAQHEAARNMSVRAVAVQPRDVLLDPAKFEPTLRASLRTGNIALSELGNLSAEAGEANRRGQLSTAGRRSIERAIDSSIKNSAGVIDPAAAVPRNTALAAARPDGVVQRTLGATPRAEAIASANTQVSTEAVQRDARARLAAPVTVASSQLGVSVAARAIDNAGRPTAARSTTATDAKAEQSFDFHDPKVAQEFVRSLTAPGKVSAGQRSALVDSVLQKGAMSLGELRAFQIALDDAATQGLVTRTESEQAWRVIASAAAKHVGGSTIAAKVQAEDIAKHGGVQRIRG